MHDIQLSTLMTTNVRGVARHSKLREVVAAMAQNSLSCTLVTDQDVPIGIITERDIVRLLLATEEAPNILDWPAEQVMSAPIICLNDNETLYDALVVSKAEKLRHLPVVNKSGKLAGLVTPANFAEAHFHVIEMQAELIEQAVRDHTTDLLEANEELQALSMEDPLMQIGNRRAMEVDLEHTHASALRYKRQYSVSLLDVDFFKKFNDHYGHAAGDEVLRTVGQSLQASMRKSDRIYRYGGEEVLVLLADTDAEGAMVFMKRAVSELEKLGITHELSPFGVLTGSAGVASCIRGDKCYPNWQSLVDAADRALYEAKNQSRNIAKLAA